MEKDKPDTIYFKHSYDEDIFREISIALPEKSVTICVTLSVLANETTVTKAKKKDDMMCRELAIPRQYYSFYESLKVCGRSDGDNITSVVLDNAEGMK